MAEVRVADITEEEGEFMSSLLGDDVIKPLLGDDVIKPLLVDDVIKLLGGDTISPLLDGEVIIIGGVSLLQIFKGDVTEE